ncbi:MAG: KH domain-containing protein [Clostridiales bacterium]|jgi:predicted RNA-binding protein YlqC (UPF0109 family)|nr:KH domain-containing protein [Clostridiales bacterium]
MQDLIKFLVKELAGTEDVEIKETEKNGFLDIEIFMDKHEAGKVIGKQGRIAKALRTVVKAAAAKRHIRCNVIIKEKEEQEAKEAQETQSGQARKDEA